MTSNSSAKRYSLSDVRRVGLRREKSVSLVLARTNPHRDRIECSRLGPLHKESNRRDDDCDYDYDLNYARKSHSPPGEVVGITAVYDKSVSTEEIRAAVNNLYGKRPPSFHSDSMSTWRIEEEQFAISIFDGTDGAKELTYLKFVTYTSGMKSGTYPSLLPAAHISDCRK